MPEVLIPHATCDSCGERDKDIVEVDEESQAYVCADCWAIEEAAVTSAAMALALALNHATLGLNRPGPNTLAITRAVLAAYWKSRLGTELIDGSSATSEPTSASEAK